MSKVRGFIARVSGHTLQDEGRYLGYDRGSEYAARCSCGKVHGVETAAEAKRWHRSHKQDIAEGRDPRGAA